MVVVGRVEWNDWAKFSVEKSIRQAGMPTPASPRKLPGDSDVQEK